MTKICTGCKQEFVASLEHFHKRLNGLTSCCKSCGNKRSKKWRTENPEKSRSSKRRSEEKHPRKKRSSPERLRRGYLRLKAWEIANPERIKSAKRQRVAKRRALLRNAKTGKVDFDLIAQRDQMLCLFCGEKIQRSDLHFAHIVPISRGGKHTAENIHTAHKLGNLRQHGRILDELNEFRDDDGLYRRLCQG